MAVAAAPDPALKRVRAIVRGDVQGVGFRAATAEEARRGAVAGWVRNLRDGSVEVVAEGTVDAVGGLIKWLRRGPSLARVTAELMPSGPPTIEGCAITLLLVVALTCVEDPSWTVPPWGSLHPTRLGCCP